MSVEGMKLLNRTTPAAWPYLDKFEVADIGTPPELVEKDI